jgi:UDP-N-acetylmuramyl pentapeptide phosphotransferase/UDP-N-acetylglucosamine-1-phosphate transferase
MSKSFWAIVVIATAGTCVLWNLVPEEMQIWVVYYACLGIGVVGIVDLYRGSYD